MSFVYGGSPALGKRVEDLGPLPVRARNGLRRRGIRYVGELVQLTRAELMKTKNLGPTSVLEIRESLGQFGLDLGMTLDPGWRAYTPIPWIPRTAAESIACAQRWGR